MSKSKNTIITVRDLVLRENLLISRAKTDEVSKQETGELRWENPGDLLLDHEYQRGLNVPHAMEIAKKFDYLNMKPATGFMNADGKILITDGQHTVTAAYIVGAPKVPVYVHFMPEGISDASALAMQSKQFLSINLSNRAVGRFEIYNNRLIQARADELAFQTDANHARPYKGYLDIEAMCVRVKAYPGPSTKTHRAVAGSITHIKNLETAWFNIGAKPSEDTLMFLRKYFPNETIDGGLHIGLVHFMSNMEKVARTRQDAIWDPVILYKAMTKDGTLTMAKSYDYLQEESALLGFAGNAQVQKWVAGSLRAVYNNYISENDLDVQRLGRYV